MEYISHEHRSGLTLLRTEFPNTLNEIHKVISSIADENIIERHEEQHAKRKSISSVLNDLLKERFIGAGWKKESPIFADANYQKTDKGRRDGVWRLDFANPDGSVSVEVSYNHGEALAWNLLKPVLASELNHVSKAIQTKLGVIILATQELKDAGGFDGAVGTYEKAIQYLLPLQSQLTVPLVLIGLNAPATFWVEHVMVEGKKRAEFHRR